MYWLHDKSPQARLRRAYIRPAIRAGRRSEHARSAIGADIRETTGELEADSAEELRPRSHATTASTLDVITKLDPPTAKLHLPGLFEPRHGCSAYSLFAGGSVAPASRLGSNIKHHEHPTEPSVVAHRSELVRPFTEPQDNRAGTMGDGTERAAAMNGLLFRLDLLKAVTAC